MDFLIIMFIIFVFVYWISKETVVTTYKEEPCKIHSWKYDINNQMYCGICKVRPGDLNEEH